MGKSIIKGKQPQFEHGVLSALAILDGHGEATIYREIVAASGGWAKLWYAAENYDRAHLLRNADEKGKIELRAVAATGSSK